MIQRHQVSANPNVANSNGQILLTYSQPYDNHNGGWLGFGPEDGLLYIAAGDGGLGGDPEERAQDLSTLLGKMLRIDVDSGSPCGIPSGNPFDGVGGARDEIWAYGLRNPWRASFDPPTGRLFVADVGQGTWEEVDIVEKGKNYGWDVVEGPECFEPSSGCDFTGLESPIHWYGRSVGRSVTGGYVYRGQEIPSLVGDYVFGDYRSGRIWALTEGAGGWSRVQLFSTARSISSFGVDEDLELYLVDHDGSILKLTSTTTTPAPDLVVTKNSQEDNYFPDEDIVFEIDVQNQGPGDATDVTLTDNLPAGLSFVSAAPSQGSCSSQGSTVTCDLGAIDNNSSAQVTLTAKAVQPGEFTNSASAVSDPPDSNNGNNSGDFTGMIGESADLSLKKSVESTLVEIGTEFDYTIEVTNHGPSTATQVLVRDSLASGLSPVSAPDPCRFLQNEQFFCEFTAIGANSSRAVDFRVRAAQTGQIDNSATVSASQVDPVDTNNFDSVSVTIVATPDLEVRKTDLGPFVVGSTGYYRLLVFNVGNAAPGGPVTISDELPPSLGLLSAHSAGWSCETNAMSLFCSLQDSLPPGQSRGLTLAVLVGPGAVPLVINEARVSNSQDINPGTRRASPPRLSKSESSHAGLPSWPWGTFSASRFSFRTKASPPGKVRGSCGAGMRPPGEVPGP